MALREKILIIGNGFDLYHELPTKYSQFIKVLMNIEDLNIEDKDISFDDLFKDVERNTEMKIRFDTEKMTFDKNIIIKIKDNLQNNCWYKSFREKLSFENWIDVENEIKLTLKLLDSIINDINIFLQQNKHVSRVKINDNTNIFKSKIELNLKELHYCNIFYLTQTNDDWTFNTENFECRDNTLIKFKTEKYYIHLFVDLQTFTNIFNLYLESIIGLFYSQIDSEYLNNLEKIDNQFSHYFNFNYTPTLGNFYGIQMDKVKYLHGKHNSLNHNIVLGIDEVIDEINNNDEIFMFTKYYQKLFNNTDYQFLIEMNKPSSKYEDIDKDFILFGHSLADNDQNYLKELFDVIKLRETNTVTILFHTFSDKAQKLKNLLKIIGRNDVEFLMKKKRLNFIQINDKPFETVFKSLPESYYIDMSPTIH